MSRCWRSLNNIQMKYGHSDVRTFAELQRLPTVREVVQEQSSVPLGHEVQFTYHHYVGDGATEGVLRHYVGLKHTAGDPADDMEDALSLWVADECAGHGLHGGAQDGLEVWLLKLEDMEDVKKIARSFRKSSRALTDGVAGFLELEYLCVPLSESEKEGYEITVRALLDDGSRDGADLVATLLRLELRVECGFLLGSVPYDQDLSEVADLVVRLNFREIQFGRFGNAAAALRRAAAALLVGVYILGEYVAQNCSRVGFLNQALAVSYPLEKFAALCWGGGLGLAPVERAEKRLLKDDTILRLREIRAQLREDVSDARFADWRQVFRWTGLPATSQPDFLRDVGLAIDAAAVSCESYPFYRLDCPPYNLLLASCGADFCLPTYLNLVASADGDTLDAGFTTKVRHFLATFPALLPRCRRSLEDCCRMALKMPTAIYFCERSRKFSSKGHKGRSGFTTVNESSWAEKYLQQNLMRANIGKTVQKGPRTLSEAWASSGASQVRCNSMFFKESAGAHVSLEQQQKILTESNAAYSAHIKANPDKHAELMDKVGAGAA
eukprot:g5496.t1